MFKTVEMRREFLQHFIHPKTWQHLNQLPPDDLVDIVKRRFAVGDAKLREMVKTTLDMPAHMLKGQSRIDPITSMANAKFAIHSGKTARWPPASGRTNLQ